MCIACEMGFWIAMDELPDEPPPGFPGARPDEPSRFACEAAGGEGLKSDTPEGERKSLSEKP